MIVDFDTHRASFQRIVCPVCGWDTIRDPDLSVPCIGCLRRAGIAGILTSTLRKMAETRGLEPLTQLRATG